MADVAALRRAPMPPRARHAWATIALILVLAHPVAAQDFSALDPAAGQALFERNWVPAPASTTASDGLGPHFNARSCAACHEGGGAGDIDLPQMNLLTSDPAHGGMLQLRAVPGLQPEVRAELAYTVAAQVTLNGGTATELQQPELTLDAGHDSATLIERTSLRRAPSLQGLAALDGIPLRALRTRADPDDQDGDGISGRIADGNGRFGWRADATTLREQVARALSLDLGLGSPLFPSAAGDCTPRQPECLDAARQQTGDAFETPDVVLDLLVAYLAALPLPSTPETASAGAGLFAMLGCAACHTPQPDPAQPRVQAYTDLLLHDLGPGLASAGDSEWRTAPLWGIRERARLLHDGRARNLDEAVLWHGGEAATSAHAYRELNSGQRELLRTWLLGL
ncbi:MAG TPA: di-heme oxidoredictase family protein [Pseudomonadales bacterium]